jgi:aldehyde dehydrogenase (NAD+)
VCTQPPAVSDVDHGAETASATTAAAARPVATKERDPVRGTIKAVARRGRPRHVTDLDKRQDRSPVPSAFDYAPAPESREIVSLEERYGLFIGGEYVEPRSGDFQPTISPASEEPLAHVAYAGDEDVDLAVGAARDAFDDGWSDIAAAERSKYLFRIARILQERSREFAVLESLDGGKPIRESRDVDLPLSAAHFFYYAGWADKLEYAFPNRRPRPVGVAAQIIPWNFPLLMLAWKIAPALAAGNTVVLKPAESTPLTALLFCDVLRQAGLPPGVVNIVTGDGRAGAALVKHPDVDKVAFTGSTEVGKEIQKAVAGTDKKLTLELGGKAANVVFDDAPLDQAIEGIINGIYFNQGHVCCAGSRLLVQESIYEPLIAKLKRRMGTLRVGDPLDKNTDIGAINSKQQLEKIKELVAAGEAEGAEVFQPACRLPERGWWFAPTVFTSVAQSYRIAQEEIFGPVLSVLTFRTPDEAVEKANNTAYGLAAGVWTEKGSRILSMAQRLRAGVVWANTYNRFDPSSPFGGYKESGFGREGGLHGLEPYVRFE